MHSDEYAFIHVYINVHLYENTSGRGRRVSRYFNDIFLLLLTLSLLFVYFNMFFPFMNILSVIFGMKFIYCLLRLVLSKICITFVYLAHTFQFLKQGIQPAHTSSPQFLANIKCGIGDGPKSKHKPCPHFLASKVKNSDFSNTNFCARKTSCGLKLNHLPHRTPSARPRSLFKFLVEMRLALQIASKGSRSQYMRWIDGICHRKCCKRILPEYTCSTQRSHNQRGPVSKESKKKSKKSPFFRLRYIIWPTVFFLNHPPKNHVLDLS